MIKKEVCHAAHGEFLLLAESELEPAFDERFDSITLGPGDGDSAWIYHRGLDRSKRRKGRF
jgi:hypothetical protein